MQDFAYRLKIRDSLVTDPTLWFWTPAFQEVISWLRRNCNPGSAVLDVGCGPGLFMHALRRSGFEAVGVDVGEAAVNLNRRDGFRVWHGPVETLPADWVHPKAVVCLFVLHHLVDPVGTLRCLRILFPEAFLAIAQYGPSNFDLERTTPPRTLSRWNKQSLETALAACNYDAKVLEINSLGTESAIMKPFMHARQKLGLSPKGYRLTKNVERYILPLLLAPFQRQAFVLLALAQPTRSPQPHRESTSAMRKT